MKTWEQVKDEMVGPTGSPARKKWESETAKWARHQTRLDKIFSWMKYIPPRMPSDKDEQGYDHNYWKGVGPLMFLFWRTLADEGFYGTLDMLAFHYFNDKYVLTFKDIRRIRKEARLWRNRYE